MADNTTLNSMSGGDTIATDDISGVKHQLVKMEFGVDGSATPVSTSNRLPVDATITVIDGGDLATGSTTDAGVTSNAAGSLSAKLRGLVTIFADVWDSVSHFLKVSHASLLSGEDLIQNVLGTLMKPVPSNVYASSNYSNVGAATKANIKSSLGNVFAIRVTNTNAAVRYFQLHNKASAPVATETAQFSVLVPAGSATVPGVVELNSTWFAPSEYFTTGIGFAISTTATTFTDSATAAEHEVKVRYI